MCERRRLAAGEVLVRQGESSNEMFFVVSGRVQVELKSTSNQFRGWVPVAMTVRQTPSQAIDAPMLIVSGW